MTSLKSKYIHTLMVSICANLLICLSCQGMEDMSNQDSDSNSKKQRVDNTQSTKDEGSHEENLPGGLHLLTKSEFISLEGIIAENNKPGKLNRRVSAGQHQKFQELRKNKLDFEEALSISKTREFK